MSDGIDRPLHFGPYRVPHIAQPAPLGSVTYRWLGGDCEYAAGTRRQQETAFKPDHDQGRCCGFHNGVELIGQLSNQTPVR